MTFNSVALYVIVDSREISQFLDWMYKTCSTMMFCSVTKLPILTVKKLVSKKYYTNLFLFVSLFFQYLEAHDIVPKTLLNIPSPLQESFHPPL